MSWLRQVVPGFQGQLLDIFYEAKPDLLERSALALGFFDGVHPGHQVVIKKAVEEAARLNATPAVVTFKEHPRSLTQGAAPQLITLVEERLALCAELGIQAALVMSFTEDLCRLTPREYVENVLVKALHPLSLSVGFNHRFGRNRQGDPELLRELGKEFGYDVHVAQGVNSGDMEVSSSRIRASVTTGHVEQAAQLMQRPFRLAGTVLKGDQRGRQLGFPTANLSIQTDQIQPARGVYSGVCTLADGSRHTCVINIGYRPTVTHDTGMTTEVHILDYTGDLYGQRLQVDFLTFIRAEEKFAGVEALKEQITRDCQTARQVQAAAPSAPIRSL